MNTRPAEIGDQGVLVGLENHRSIATLILRVGVDELAHLYGDRRMAADLVETFEGERVEVVEAEGSSYGAHGILPLALGHDAPVDPGACPATARRPTTCPPLSFSL